MFWPASTSLTCAATTVTVQTVPEGSAAFAVRVKVVPVAEGCVNALGTPTGHCNVNDEALTFTDSLNVIEMVALSCTSVAPPTGEVGGVTVGSVLVVNVLTSLAAMFWPTLSV